MKRMIQTVTEAEYDVKKGKVVRDHIICAFNTPTKARRAIEEIIKYQIANMGLKDLGEDIAGTRMIGNDEVQFWYGREWVDLYTNMSDFLRTLR